MKIKLTTIKLDIPLKGAGNAIRQKEAEFEVYQEEDIFILIPLLSVDERRIANLPEQLSYSLQKGKPVSTKGAVDGNFHIIEDAVIKLRQTHDFEP